MRTFRSDNNAGLCDEAMQAVIDANRGHQIAYGDDESTAHAIEVFRGIFGPETSAWFVATGTAANTLAVAALTQPWQEVICHAHSHYAHDESTAPERITHCRVTTIHTPPGVSKVTPRDLEQAMTKSRGDVHQAQPGVVTISNVTEFGTIYTPAETKAICAAAHAVGYAVHVDGARFANAVARLGCDPRALTIDSGVDALSFGGTKNGLAYGEAVLFFPQGDGRRFERAVENFPFHRKSAGHLLSKHRFVAAPFAAALRDGAWLRHAAHANAMAADLARGLTQLALEAGYPTEANAVFVRLSPAMDSTLRRRGYGYYPFGAPSWRLFRLMCSFDTTPGDIEALLADVKAALAEGAH